MGLRGKRLIRRRIYLKEGKWLRFTPSNLGSNFLDFLDLYFYFYTFFKNLLYFNIFATNNYLNFKLSLVQETKYNLCWFIDLLYIDILNLKSWDRLDNQQRKLLDRVTTSWVSRKLQKNNKFLINLKSMLWMKSRIRMQKMSLNMLDYLKLNWILVSTEL